MTSPALLDTGLMAAAEAAALFDLPRAASGGEERRGR
jgi:hypothetical protein